MKLILKEAPNDFEDNREEIVSDDTVEIQAPLEKEVNDIEDNKIDDKIEDEIFTDETDAELAKFIISPELEELRDILVDLDTNPQLLLLDNKVIVIGVEDVDNEYYLYCLGDDDDELSLVKQPMRLDDILSNSKIIQYTPSNVSDVHDRVVELFMKELSDEQTPEEEIPTDEEVVAEIDKEEPEVVEDEEDEIEA